MAALPEIPESDARVEAHGSAPRIWGLLGNRRGDNAMIEAAIAASGLAGRMIQLRFNALGALQNLRRGGSLYSIRAATKVALAPPWPDVVVTSGKRAVPAALWVRAASGDRARLVHLGRPQAPLHWFDLVVTTPQYGLPARPNVMICRLPVTRFDEPNGVAPLEFARTPRPFIAVLVGGTEPPQMLDADSARDLTAAAVEAARASGGSLLVATSPRTGAAAMETIRLSLAASDVPYWLSIFGEGPNMFRAFLSAADRFIVTDDSVSMVVEAAATGRPVELFRLPRRSAFPLRAFKALERAASGTGPGRATVDALVGHGLIRSNRDIAGYMDALERDGLLAGGDRIRRLADSELTEVGERLVALANA